MIALLFKLFLAQTNRGLVAGLALFVILFSFCLFMLNADGWRFGIIGIACLGILSLRDIITSFFRPKTRVPPLSATLDTTTNDITEPFPVTVPQTLAAAIYLAVTNDNVRHKALIAAGDGATVAKKATIDYFSKKYLLPDVVKEALNNGTATPEVLSLYTGSPEKSFFICDLLKLFDTVQNTVNTTSSRPWNVS